MKNLILLSTTLLLVLFANAQIVNIPDANFKAALVNHIPVIDTNYDGEIQVSEAETFNGQIFVSNKNISDLTGIEYFINITSLNCSDNQLDTLYLSNNTLLTHLYCLYNQIDTIDVSSNVALIELYCEGNQLSSLDVSNNTVLSYLDIINNQIDTLDLSNNTSLTGLNCAMNLLDTLDLSNNTLLTGLSCGLNYISGLDLTNNISLTYLYCSNNQLISLKVKNGNNSNFINFNANYNPNLFCIEVDDPNWSTVNWTNIDPQSFFSSNCSVVQPIVYIPDTNFKAYLIGNSSINTNMDAEIQVSEASYFTGTIEVNNKNISELTGIEFFTSINALF
ncbi:MAG: hypothetical protein ABIJ97_14520, partial [Bacteroidota bacterium]